MALNSLVKLSCYKLIDNFGFPQLFSKSSTNFVLLSGTLIDIFVTLLAVFESAGDSVPEDSAAIIVNKAIEIRRGLNATHNAATLTSIE